MSIKHKIPELDAKGLRKFSYTFSVVLCLLFGLVLPFLFNHSFPLWPWISGVIFSFWGSLAPSTLRPIYISWMKIGIILSRITTPLILGILFYGILTPVGVFMRLIKFDPLERVIDRESLTHRISSDASYKTDFEKPY